MVKEIYQDINSHQNQDIISQIIPTRIIVSQVIPNDFPLDTDEDFMRFCNYISQYSNDPKTKVGACVVDKAGKIVSAGWNHLCVEVIPLLEKTPEFDILHEDTDNKHPYSLHAEANAIMSATMRGIDLRNCTLYATYFPCDDCAKLIVQTGLSRLFYAKFKDSKFIKATNAKILLTSMNVELNKIEL